MIAVVSIKMSTSALIRPNIRMLAWARGRATQADLSLDQHPGNWQGDLKRRNEEHPQTLQKRESKLIKGWPGQRGGLERTQIAAEDDQVAATGKQQHRSRQTVEPSDRCILVPT